ncbi:MAG: SDR family NAD(P)-dependent oxidoreductase [Holophagales bacterium]|jgi:uncharacterized oxidoreductase|nr:SDR family NAD(P)-dependent oxidoreductase [Holophagales bacterium]
MQTKGNTILITGGGTGIGFGLARAFHASGNQVIIASRRKDVLDDAVKNNPGIASYMLDIQNTSEIKAFATKVLNDFPGLNVLINNSGIMRAENLLDQRDLTNMEAIIATNLLGPLRLTAALLPSLLKQQRAVILNVSSGLAFVPMAITPTYCATKAALHSYTQSLRCQLKNTNVQVVELIPPYVATHLMNGADDPMAMPLDDYIAEVMEIIKSQPNAAEICVENVKRFRFAAETGNHEKFFQAFNAGVQDAINQF